MAASRMMSHVDTPPGGETLAVDASTLSAEAAASAFHAAEDAIERELRRWSVEQERLQSAAEGRVSALRDQQVQMLRRMQELSNNLEMNAALCNVTPMMARRLLGLGKAASGG